MKSTSVPGMAEQSKTPMPKNVFKFANPIIGFILRSPFHGMLSHAMMLLTIKGRKSGRLITTPVGYTRRENSLVVFTFGNWWKNLGGNTEVSMRLQGRQVQGRANIVHDPHTVGAMVNGVFDARGEEMAKRMGFERIPDSASSEEIEKKSQAAVFIQIDL